MRFKDEDKQERLKEAMVRLILEEGIDGTSVSKIAKAAGVSPATIYVYYESKEDMLTEVFREYSKKPYQYLMNQVNENMNAGELIEAIVRGCYDFSTEHADVFSFVEQCSRCPSVSEYVDEHECGCDIFDLIHTYQANGILKDYSDRNIGAVLFAPVRFLAMNRCEKYDNSNSLDELISMLKELLIL